MSFFRRRRKEKDEPAKPEVTSKSTAKGGRPATPTSPTPKATGKPSGPETAPSSPAETTAEPAPITPTEERPRSPPPPLPDRAAPMTEPLPIVPRPLSQCFVCGTPLEAGRCPKCRMTWVE